MMPFLITFFLMYCDMKVINLVVAPEMSIKWAQDPLAQAALDIWTSSSGSMSCLPKGEGGSRR